jgi:hypothetical protein
MSIEWPEPGFICAIWLLAVIIKVRLFVTATCPQRLVSIRFFTLYDLLRLTFMYV